MRRHIVIGDIHGMLDALIDLLSRVDLSKDDTLILVGDLLDKGPNPVGVVTYLMNLRNDGYDVRLTLGNHEHKHARYRRAIHDGRDTSNFKGLKELKSITSLLTDAEVQFLETAELYHVLPDHKGVVIHAGVSPRHNRLHTLQEVSTMDRHKREKAMSVTFIRYVDPDGRWVQLGKEQDEDRYWADIYDGRFGHIYFGHEAFEDAEFPVQFPHATGMDLGAVYGNRLAAAVITDQGVEFVTTKI